MAKRRLSDIKCPDFIDTNGAKKVVEVFGEYWHRRKKNIAWHQTEKGTMKVYRQYGFSCLILWENELKTSSDEDLKIKLESFMKS